MSPARSHSLCIPPCREKADSAVPVPSSIENALANHPTPSSSQALSSSPRVTSSAGGPGASKNRDSLQRKQLWWLPYVVLEFDKNEVLVDALGGDLNGPVWMYSATFDVSRISEIGVTAYLRTQHPGLEAKKDGGASGNGNGNGGEGQDMGNSDLCLGGIRFTPDLETGVSRPLPWNSDACIRETRADALS